MLVGIRLLSLAQPRLGIHGDVTYHATRMDYIIWRGGYHVYDQANHRHSVAAFVDSTRLTKKQTTTGHTVPAEAANQSAGWGMRRGGRVLT